MAQCINCEKEFTPNDVYYYFGPPGIQGSGVVGPFCEKCDGIIKVHIEPEKTCINCHRVPPQLCSVCAYRSPSDLSVCIVCGRPRWTHPDTCVEEVMKKKSAKKSTPKKRNPQDTTLRNVNALKKRVAALEETVAEINEKLAHY